MESDANPLRYGAVILDEEQGARVKLCENTLQTSSNNATR
jgi:hypothetical protein